MVFTGCRDSVNPIQTQTDPNTLVLSVAVTGVTLDRDNLSLVMNGAEGVLTAEVHPIEATNKNVSWESSDTDVATVEDGIVTAISVGTAVITVTTADGEFADSCDVTVIPAPIPVDGITLDLNSLSLTVGAKGELTPTIHPYNASNTDVIWESSDTDVATVEDGIVTATDVGTATITVTTTDGGHTDTCDVTVTIVVTGVSISPNPLNLIAGSEGKLTALVTPDNATNTNVSWKSSNDSIATVDATGMVKAVGKGTANITVTTVDGNKTDTCAVTVTIPVTGVTISPKHLNLTVGNMGQLTVNVTPGNASNTTVTWESSNTGVATVNIDGLVTAISAGTATITITTKDGSNKTDTCAVTVTSVPETTFTPQTLLILPGNTQSSFNLNWYGDVSEGVASQVRLYNSSGVLMNIFTGTSGEATTGKQWHKASVSGLSLGTSYKYSVSNNGSAWSEKYSYNTIASGAVTFAYLGDPQLEYGSVVEQGSNWAKTLSEAKNKGAQFFVSAGDQVNGEGSTTADHELEYTYLLLPAVLKELPFAPALGNHEENSTSNPARAHITEIYEYHYNVPNLQSGLGSNSVNKQMYWYRYNNVLFIVLNTGSYIGSSSLTSTRSAYNTVINNAKAANAGLYDWIIVQHHRTTIPISEYKDGHDSVLTRLMDMDFEGLMVDQGVDLVFAGHEHIYTRSHVIRNDNKTNTLTSKLYTATGSSPFSNLTGPLYFTADSGSSSMHYYSGITNPLYPHIAFAKPGPNDDTSTSDRSGYNIVTVNGKQLTFTAYRLTRLDRTSPSETVTETFVINKK